MGHRILAAAISILLLLSGTAGSPAHAGDSADGHRFLRASPFEGHIVFCAPRQDPVSVEVLPDGTVITTFVNDGNIWRAGNPLVDGVEFNTVVATEVPDSPTSSADIRGTVTVDALHGLWAFRQIVTAGPEGASGFGFGLGFGDLLGKFLVFETGSFEMIPDSPCEVPFAAPLAGRVISFGWLF